MPGPGVDRRGQAKIDQRGGLLMRMDEDIGAGEISMNNV
jgi:hypothetical protein